MNLIVSSLLTNSVYLSRDNDKNIIWFIHFYIAIAMDRILVKKTRWNLMQQISRNLKIIESLFEKIFSGEKKHSQNLQISGSGGNFFHLQQKNIGIFFAHNSATVNNWEALSPFWKLQPKGNRMISIWKEIVFDLFYG